MGRSLVAGATFVAVAALAAVLISGSGTGADPRNDVSPAAVALEAPGDPLASELAARLEELRECSDEASGIQSSSRCDATQAEVERLFAELNTRSERILASEPEASEELLAALEQWRACMNRAGYSDVSEPAVARQRADLLDDPKSTSTDPARSTDVTTTVLGIAEREDQPAPVRSDGGPTTTLAIVPPLPDVPQPGMSPPDSSPTSTTFSVGLPRSSLAEAPGDELRRQSDRCEVDAKLDDAMRAQYEMLIAADQAGAN